MRSTKHVLAFLAVLATPLAVMAATFDDDNLPYTDVNASWDLETRVSVSFLTDEGILRGNDDGTFAQGRTLNRAEFMTIVMRVLDSQAPYARRCFPDMPANAWYEEDVCRAKALGIVEGNALAGLRPEQYPFQPSRPVQYEEAVKVLVIMYALPMETDIGLHEEWYENYIRAAINADVELREGYPGLQITRGQMARLVANFEAHSRGELEDLRDAQGQGSSHSRSTSRSSLSSSSSTSSRFSMSSGSSSFPFSTFDADADVSMRSRFILLNDVSPVMAAASIFLSTEPLDVDEIGIVLDSAVDTVDSFEIYRGGDGAYLGRATLDSDDDTDRTYTLRLSNHSLVVGQKQSQQIYARARLKATNTGGDSGELVQVAAIEVFGFGQWSNTRYSQSLSDNFPVNQTARAHFTEIANAGPSTELLIGGNQQIVGQFRFAGEETDNLASATITELRFQISATTGVTLTNVKLGATDTSETTNCTVSSGLITCASIPGGVGEIDDDTRTLRLLADVAIDPGLSSAFLQISLNESGTPSSSGSMTWNDNEAIFTWMDTGSPVVRGTSFTR